MAYFSLPLRKRFTKIFDGKNSLFLSVKFVEVDGIGVFVEYDKEEKLTPENIRSHFCPITETECIVEAETPEGAIEKFLRSWEGAQGECPGIWINDKKIIVKYPFCEFLNRTKEDKFICGPKLRGEECGTRGMCVLEWGIDPPPTGFCSISEMKIDKSKAVKISVGENEYLFIDANKK